MANFILPVQEPRYFLLVSLILFIIIFTRYLIISGAYHYLFFRVLKEQYEERFLNSTPIEKKQLREEVWRSALTSLIFAPTATLMLLAWQEGFTLIYTDWIAYPLWYLPVSLALFLFLQETYYYWIHRWMHRPKIYRKIHKWHHDSLHTTTLTSFSFHPIESILQAIILPILIFIIPLHYVVLLILLLIMTIAGTINHAGVEVYPKWFIKSKVFKWLIGATHHDIHHKKFRFNFGLYFTFWDRWMDTESPDFEQEFEKQTKKA